MGRANTTLIPLNIWAACCNTWLLIKLKPKGVVFSFLFSSCLFFSFLWTLYLEVDALLALEDANELTRNDAALVDELVEGVLPVSAWLSKVHLTRLKWQPAAINRHPLTVALHRHLQSAALVRQWICFVTSSVSMCSGMVCKQTEGLQKAYKRRHVVTTRPLAS